MGLFGNGLARTRQSIFGRIAQLVGNTEIDSDTWDDIESVLVQADVGVNTTRKIIEDMRARIRRDVGAQAVPGAAQIRAGRGLVVGPWYRQLADRHDDGAVLAVVLDEDEDLRDGK